MSDPIQLLQRCRDGEISAVSQLLQTYQQPLFRLAYSLLRSSEDAIRAVQAALLAAIYSPTRKRTDETFDTWLNALLLKACQDVMTRRKLLRQTVSAVYQVAEEPTETSARPAEVALWNAFQKLNDDLRIPLTLRYFHNIPLAQIARILRISKRTARTRLGEGRDRLMSVTLSNANATEDEKAAPQAGMIGHDQAHLLLQSAQDEPLSSQEWVPLQLHLDSCEACRTYRKRLQNLERDLPRTLRLRLEMPGRVPVLSADELLERQRAGMRQRKLIFSLAKAAGILAILGAAVFLMYNMFLPAPIQTGEVLLTPQALTQIARTPLPTATAVLPVAFNTPILFESERDSNAEIYLLDPSGQAINVTQNPAQDTAPSWSPDGEWIAFLSDRNGKTEVFVMRVSGTQVYQLTNAADVTWQGPISWSGDGKRLALSGNWSGDDNHSWVYLVSVDATRPLVRLSYSRDVHSPRWAPQGDWLAYEQTANGINQLYARQVSSDARVLLSDGQFGTVSYRQPYLSPTGAYDWTPTGTGLVYVNNGPYANNQGVIQQTPVPNANSNVVISSYNAQNGLTGNATVLASAPLDSQIVSASSSPTNILAFLQVSVTSCTKEGWYRLNVATRGEAASVYTQPTATAVPLILPQICASLPLSDTAWTQDGRWLVLNAILGKESQSALYALDVVSSQSSLFQNKDAQLIIARLTEPGNKDRNPQVRPRRALLGIEPKPLPTLDPTPQASGSTVDISKVGGQIIYSSAKSGSIQIYGVSSLGIGEHNLSFTEGNNSTLLSASHSPNGDVAFLSNRNSGGMGAEELFVMDANGGNIRQLTGTPTDPRPDVPLGYPNFSWSPDGKTLASTLFTREGWYLAIMPTTPDEKHPNHYYYLQSSGNFTRISWLPDSSMLLFYEQPNRTGENAFYAHSLLMSELDAPNAVRQQQIIGLSKAEVILDAVFMASSKKVAVLTSDIGPGVSGEARSVNLYAALLGEDKWQKLGGFYQPRNTNDPSLSVVPDQSEVVIKIDNRADNQFKTTLTLVDTNTGEGKELLKSEDVINHLAFSGDGKWLFYSTETSLWALANLDVRVGGDFPSVKVLNEPVLNFDWIP